MGHTHHHSHDHFDPNIPTLRLMITMALNFSITLAELIGGLLAGSLSLISDALHNFSDGVAIIISYIALKLRNRSVTEKHTFGLKRTEIFAAALNSGVLLVITFYLFYHAVLRIIHPTVVEGSLMMLVAGIGLLANVIGTILLARPSKESMNLKSAYLHLLSDAVSSFGVLLGGFAIYQWNIYWIDPILTILIGIYILKESFQILQGSIHILMEGAPPDLSIEEIKKEIENLPEVNDFYHIHLWMVGENDIHIEGHVDVQDMLLSESSQLRYKIEHLLQEKFNIKHITLQFECNHCINANTIERKKNQKGIVKCLKPQFTKTDAIN
ncbi:MAG: cation transporter [Caldisericaceae bacterium]|nr:cation transporter [Caldisericaceae bacterium]